VNTGGCAIWERRTLTATAISMAMSDMASICIITGNCLNHSKKKSNELETLNQFFVGRELKMIALKKEINELLKEFGRDEKYTIHD